MVRTMSPFDYLNSINQGAKGEDRFSHTRGREADPAEKDNYLPFIINRSLSYHKDAILFSNEMNRLPDLPHHMQFDFYRFALRPRKRFAKWSKQEEASSDIKLIQKAFDYSREKAEQVYDLFDKKQLKEMRRLFDEGGQ